MLARSLFALLGGGVLSITSLTAPALAGGPTVVVEETPVAEAMAPASGPDWQGFYAGLSFAKPNGENFWSGGPIIGSTTTESFGGSMTSLTIGKDWQRGSFVFGLALSYGKGDIVAHPQTSLLLCADCDTTVSNMANLHGRLGFAMGRTLVYATAGIVRADAEGIYTGNFVGGSDTLSGKSYGVGIEQMLGSNLSVSAEFLKTDLGRLDLPALCMISNCYTDIKFDQMQLGLNFRF